jgi:hypothetical protein
LTGGPQDNHFGEHDRSGRANETVWLGIEQKAGLSKLSIYLSVGLMSARVGHLPVETDGRPDIVLLGD